MELTKSDLIAKVAEKTDVTKTMAANIINTSLEEISAALANRNSVNISGFGKFQAAHRDAREARNPATGETIKVPEKYVPSFKPGKRLKEAVI